MSSKKYPMDIIHHSLHNHPIIDDLYPVLGPKKFAMLMDMWSAIFDDRFDEWLFARDSEYIYACNMLDNCVHKYINRICTDEDEMNKELKLLGL